MSIRLRFILLPFFLKYGWRCIRDGLAILGLGLLMLIWPSAAAHFSDPSIKRHD